MNIKLKDLACHIMFFNASIYIELVDVTHLLLLVPVVTGLERHHDPPQISELGSFVLSPVSNRQMWIEPRSSLGSKVQG